MSNASASNGAGTCNGMKEKIVADAVEEIWTTSCIAAVDNFHPWVIINTLYMKEECFPKFDSSVIVMVKQLSPHSLQLPEHGTMPGMQVTWWRD